MNEQQRHDRETAWGYVAIIFFIAALIISFTLNYTPWREVMR